MELKLEGTEFTLYHFYIGGVKDTQPHLAMVLSLPNIIWMLKSLLCVVVIVIITFQPIHKSKENICLEEESSFICSNRLYLAMVEEQIDRNAVITTIIIQTKDFSVHIMLDKAHKFQQMNTDYFQRNVLL